MTDKELRALKTIRHDILSSKTDNSTIKDRVYKAKLALDSIIEANDKYNEVLDNIIIYQGHTKEIKNE